MYKFQSYQRRYQYFFQIIVLPEGQDVYKDTSVSEPVFFKSGPAVSKELYICKCLQHKFIQKHIKNKKLCLIYRLHTTQRIPWPD
jgi:hypothetical protein